MYEKKSGRDTFILLRQLKGKFDEWVCVFTVVICVRGCRLMFFNVLFMFLFLFYVFVFYFGCSLFLYCYVYCFIDDSSIERVEEFKYLGTTLTNKNSIQEERKKLRAD